MVPEDRFWVEDDSGGRYQIVAWHMMLDATTIDGKAPFPGMMSYRTADGACARRIDEDTFEIVRTDTVVHRIRSQVA